MRGSRWLAPLAGGLAAGLVSGLFGVGGGVLLVPVLVLVLRRHQHEAHATSLVAVTMGAVAGLLRFAGGDSVSLAGAAAVAVGAVAGARLGAGWMPSIPERRLRQLFAGVLLVLAVRFLLVGAEPGTAGTAAPELDAVLLGLHGLGGIAAGVVSSLLGVGGGIINVPLLVIAFGYGQQVAEGTSLAIIVPTAATGAWAHHRNGYTDWATGARLGAGAVVGGVLGASLALSISPTTLGRLFGVLQVAVGVLMLRDRAPA